MLTWVFSSPSYSDDMDEFLMVSQGDPTVPALPQDIRILIQPVGIHFMDDVANEFVAIGFDLFYIDIKMTTDRKQSINIFGKGINGDVVTSLGNGDTVPVAPFIKELKNADIFTGRKYAQEESYNRRNKNKADRKFQHLSIKKDDFSNRKSVAEKLYNAVETMESNPEANFYIEIIQAVGGQGQIINITIKKIGVNAVVPAVLSILRIVSIKDEMNINKIIKPTLKKGYGAQNITVNIEDAFVFLIPPKASKNSIVLHVPEISVFQGSEWKDRQAMINNELINYFDPAEYQNSELWEDLIDKNPEKLCPVTQLAIALNNAYMDIVPTDRLSAFIEGRIDKDEKLNISRNIMQPTFVAYQSRNFKFSDNTAEMNFTRGVANIGAVNLLINVGVVEYFIAWQSETSIPQLQSLATEGVYDAHLKTIINKAKVIDKPQRNKISYNSLDIIFQGVNLTVLDDIYDTNLPIFHLTVMPISISQVESNSYNGFKDIGITLEASLFNFNSQEWEPILENFNLSIDAYTEKNDDKVTKTNLSFVNGNPAINLSTELAILVESAMNKIMKPKKDKKGEEFKTAVRQIMGRAFSQNNASMTDFDRLAVLDKFRIFDFIKQVANGPFADQYMSGANLDNTRLYGYDEAVKVSNQGISQKQINQSNFQEKTNLKPKNPLNFRYNDTLPQGGLASSRESQIRGESSVREGSINSSRKNNPIQSVYKDNNTEHLSPQEVQQLVALSDRQVDPTQNDIFLREIPFRIENSSGRDMIFALTFFDMPKLLYVRNQQARDMEYPFTLENTLLQENIIKTRTRHVFYKIFEVDESQRTFLIFSGSDINSVKKIKIPYGQSNSKEEADIKHLILDFRPLIMKKNIQLKSPTLIINDCKPHFQVHFLRGNLLVYTLQAAQNNVMPVPIDLIDSSVELDVTNVAIKTKPRFVTLELMNYELKHIRPCCFNELFCVHLYTVLNSDGDSRCLHICPPLILKNMFLADINVFILRKAMDRDYADNYLVSFEDKDLEIYTPLTEDISFRVEVGPFVSEVARITLSDANKKELHKVVWLKLEGKKKFTLNISLIFRDGSYVLTVFIQHILFDELFKRILLTQRGDRFDDQLVPLNAFSDTAVANLFKTVLQSTVLANTSVMMSTENTNRDRTKIYMVPFPKSPVWISDQKDKYEISSIPTSSLADTTHTMRLISSTTNAVENIDVVSTNSVFKLCKLA